MSIELEHGSQVVFTSLKHHHKDDLAAATTKAGFLVGPGVSKKTSLLVAGDPAVDSSKSRKAISYEIPIIGEDQFVQQFLGGAVHIEFDAPIFSAPLSADELSSPGKRDTAGIKNILKGLKEGVQLHALIDNEYGPMIVRGPATYSPLGEAWMVGGVPIASKNFTPDKSLKLLGASDLTITSHDTVQLTSNTVNHHLYGTFTVYGPLRTAPGRPNATGPWFISQ